MNIRSMQSRLERLENNAPGAVLILWGCPTKAEQEAAIKAKAAETGINPRSVSITTIRWMDEQP